MPFLSPGDLPDPGVEPRSPALQADALSSEPPGKPWMSPADVGNLISGSSAFSKSSRNIWKFLANVLLQPGLDFEHNLTRDTPESVSVV